MTIDLLIADDHEVFRCGIRSLLKHTKWLICGEAAIAYSPATDVVAGLIPTAGEVSLSGDAVAALLR